ncbi:hypothetical protein QTP88_019078 [Uroleucon formosanum]
MLAFIRNSYSSQENLNVSATSLRWPSLFDVVKSNLKNDRNSSHTYILKGSIMSICKLLGQRWVCFYGL